MLSEDINEIASTVGTGFYDGAVDMLQATLPFIIPVILIMVAFYFIYRKAGSAIGAPTSFHKTIDLPGTKTYHFKDGTSRTEVDY